MGGDDFCLKWNDHHTAFFDLAEDLCHRETLTDVVLSCGNREFSAHRLVLSICSGYFYNLFIQQQRRRGNHLLAGESIVYMKDVDPKHMELLLAFMYKGEISVNEADLYSLLTTAKGLQVKGLSDDKPQPIEDVQPAAPPPIVTAGPLLPVQPAAVTPQAPIVTPAGAGKVVRVVKKAVTPMLVTPKNNAVSPSKQPVLSSTAPLVVQKKPQEKAADNATPSSNSGAVKLKWGSGAEKATPQSEAKPPSGPKILSRKGDSASSTPIHPIEPSTTAKRARKQPQTVTRVDLEESDSEPESATKAKRARKKSQKVTRDESDSEPEEVKREPRKPRKSAQMNPFVKCERL